MLTQSILKLLTNCCLSICTDSGRRCV